ncbi:MAG TPA: acyl-CoA dehydrogenase family protein [Rhizomicrobium sp.]|jgi:alkylation response protein AidB-like acyl-CoA dehydrogenase
MEFALSSDQTMLQESLERTLARICPLERVREAAEAKEPARDVWDALVELGVPGMLIPEAFGGAGLNLLDAALVSEMLGRHVAPVPFIGSCVLAPLALRHAGSEAQQREWLPKLSSGKTRAGIAISEAIAGARDGAGVLAFNGELTGSALFVLDFAQADIFVVADAGGGLHLVNADAAGLTKIALTTIDATRALGELRFENVKAEPLPSGDTATTPARLRDAAWVMLAADTLGAGQRMIEKAVDYAKERKQFDRVIGSFQAVKHMCAEMAAELDPCRALVWYAAHAFDAIPAEASLTAAHAKAHTSEIGRFVARTATEVHGGMGFTDLLGLHYWFKRIGLNRQLLGGPERVRHLAARMQGFVD